MIEIQEIGTLIDPILICAFEGWNDAGEAASGVLDHLIEIWEPELVGVIDSEDYYDFQVNRPSVNRSSEGRQQITWPSTQIFVARPTNSECDVILVRGIEPNIKWRSFCSEILALAVDQATSCVVTLGALFAETPHTRPVRLTGSHQGLQLPPRATVELSTYEGPTGIVDVLAEACATVSMPTVSYWASVPHYLPQPPNPRGAWSLLEVLGEYLEMSIDPGGLPEAADQWSATAREFTEAEEDLADYVTSLEEAFDTANLPQATGDQIARDFERYLQDRSGD